MECSNTQNNQNEFQRILKSRITISDSADYCETIFKNMPDNSVLLTNVLTQTASNRPASTHCFVIAFRHMPEWQKIIAYSLFDDSVYIRTKQNNTWNPWISK